MNASIAEATKQDACFYLFPSSLPPVPRVVSPTILEEGGDEQPMEHDDIFAIHSIILEGEELNGNTTASNNNSNTMTATTSAWDDRMVTDESSSSEDFRPMSCLKSRRGRRRRGRRNRVVQFSNVRVQEHGLVLAPQEDDLESFHVHLDWAHAEEKTYSVEAYEINKVKKNKQQQSAASSTTIPVLRPLSRAERRQRLQQVNGGAASFAPKLLSSDRRQQQQQRRELLMDKLDGDVVTDNRRALFIASSRETSAAGGVGSSCLPDVIPSSSPTTTGERANCRIVAASNDFLYRPWHADLSLESLDMDFAVRKP